eukprot:PITA_31672
MSTIRLVLALAAQFKWKVHQMDVKSAFLNGDLQEEVYMTQPPRFKIAGQEQKVCRLAKALYGLKQAPRAWYMKIDQYLTDHGFQRSPFDANLYIKHTSDDILFVVVYVDDLIITVPILTQWIQILTGPVSVDDRKSTAGYVFSLGSGAVTWTSKKQQAVALSSTEAEYRGAVKAPCEAVWLRRMLADMHASQTGPTSLFCDNQGVLKLAKNPVFHERTKHVETHCHYIRQLVEDESVQLRYVPTTEQPADIFTKPLGPDKFVKFRGSIGVVNRLSIKGGY